MAGEWNSRSPVINTEPYERLVMIKKINKDNLFKPAKSKSETKADITDRASQAIIDSEANKRREKTERLKAQRLKAESLAQAEQDS